MWQVVFRSSHRLTTHPHYLEKWLKAIPGNLLFRSLLTGYDKIKKLLWENMKSIQQWTTEWSWRGGSPDTVVSNCRAIEIKFPFSKNNISLTETCDNKKFFRDLNNGAPSLKKSKTSFINIKVLHGYYWHQGNWFYCLQKWSIRYWNN